MDLNYDNKLRLFKSVFRRNPEEGELENLFGSRFDLGFTPKEKKVIELRYGLGGGERRTLFEVGDCLGITRKEVRQLESRAIRKIRRACLLPEEKTILPAKREGQWVIRHNGKSQLFDNFEDGVEEFRRRIVAHLNEFPECYCNGLPFEVGAFFFAKEENDEITDAELVVKSRLERLFGLLCCEETIRASEYALRALDPVKKSVYYSESDLFSDDILAVHLKQEGTVIYAKLEYGEADDVRYLFTNAFAFESTEETYYFESSQIVTTGEEERLGLAAEICISLAKCR